MGLAELTVDNVRCLEHVELTLHPQRNLIWGGNGDDSISVGDTGSADVQIALLTRRISQLTDHLKSHAKDHSSRRGLLKMVAMRRSLLDYLSKSESDRYKKLLEKLNLRK